MNGYQQTIHEIDASINPAGVEAAMRLRYGVLDHLPREDFAFETRIARDCEQACPGFLRSAAETHGLEGDYDAWEQRLRNEKKGPPAPPFP